MWILVTILFLLICFITGHLTQCFLKEKHCGPLLWNLFNKLCIGLLLLVSLYATCITGGKTVLVGVFPILFFCMKWQKPHWNPIHAHGLPIFLLLITFFFFCGVQYFRFNDFHGAHYAVDQDSSFYAGLANYVTRFGIETTILDTINLDLQYPTPYHWLDIYLIAMAQKCTGNYLFGALYIVYPFLGALSTLGIAALIEKKCQVSTKRAAFSSLIVLPLLFVGFFYINGKITVSTITVFDILYQKYTPVLIAFICFFSIKNKIVPLALLAVVYGTLAPVILITLFLYTIIRIPFHYKDRSFLREVTVVAFLFLWLLLFYNFTAKENPFFEGFIPIHKQIVLAIEQFGWKAWVKMSWLPWWNLIVNGLPVLLCILFLRVDKRLKLWRLIKENSICFLLLFISILMYISLWFMRDSIQFYYQVAIPSVIIITTLAFSQAFMQKKGMFLKIGILLFLVVSVIVMIFRQEPFRLTKIDEGFYKKLLSMDGPIGMVDDEAYIRSDNIFDKDVNYGIPFPTLRLLKDDYFPIRLDVYDVVYDKFNMIEYSIVASIENSPFYRWVESKGLRRNVKQAQILFIKEQGIQYLILPKENHGLQRREFAIDKQIDSPAINYLVYKINYDDSIQ